MKNLLLSIVFALSLQAAETDWKALYEAAVEGEKMTNRFASSLSYCVDYWYEKYQRAGGTNVVTTNNFSQITVFHEAGKFQFLISTNSLTNWVTIQDSPPPDVGTLLVMVYGSKNQVGYVETNLVCTVISENKGTEFILKKIYRDEWPSQKRIVTYSNSTLIPSH